MGYFTDGRNVYPRGGRRDLRDGDDRRRARESPMRYRTDGGGYYSDDSRYSDHDRRRRRRDLGPSKNTIDRFIDDEINRAIEEEREIERERQRRRLEDD